MRIEHERLKIAAKQLKKTEIKIIGRADYSKVTLQQDKQAVIRKNCIYEDKMTGSDNMEFTQPQ